MVRTEHGPQDTVLITQIFPLCAALAWEDKISASTSSECQLYSNASSSLIPKLEFYNL